MKPTQNDPTAWGRKGEGNYTKLRKEMFQDKKVKDIVADMKKEGFCHRINHD